MTNKKTVVILIRNDFVMHDYVKTGAFTDLDKEYKVYYLLPDYVFEKHKQIFLDKKIIVHTFDNQKYRRRNFLKVLFTYRASPYSTTYAHNFYKPNGSWAKKTYLYKFIGTKHISNILFNLIEKSISIDENLIEKIKKVKPSFMIIPISSQCMDYDLLKISKLLKIKSLALPLSWDSITSKIYSYIPPDYFLTRGKENTEYAKKIFSLSNHQAIPIGVSRYEKYFEFQKRTDLEERRKNYLTKLNINHKKNVILFAGSLRPFDETSFLEKLDIAIIRKEFKNIHVIYRPHPERDKRIKEKSFFDMNFKNITFDEELKNLYLIYKPNYQPKLDNYLELFNSIDSVILPPTSLMVETALFGKPMLALICNDGVHSGWVSSHEIVKREHFKIWINKFDWFIECNKKENFINDCKKLIETTKIHDINKKIKKDMEYIIHHDNKTYSQRILNVINNLKQ